MSKKHVLAVATFIAISAVATSAVSAPFPNGTKLTIAPWVNPPTPLLDTGTGCTYGSCFGMGVVAGLYAWTALAPGTDGGLIIGKPQKSGGQEVNGVSSSGGELTAMWDFGGNHGTFFTAPSDAGNVFDDQSCTGSACGSNTTPRKTDLAVWNTAWGGNVAPIGSASGCNKLVLSNCTADQVAGIFVDEWTIDPVGTNPRNYGLRYSQVVPTGWPNFPFKLVLRGAVQPPPVSAPLPAGTKLTITPWVDPNPATPLLDAIGCTYGSCFGMGVLPPLYAWTPIRPGTDGGLIIGKAQKSGGQEVDLASTNPGELTAMWDFGGNHGTFFTAPDASKNIFSNTSCTGSGCGSNTTPRLTDMAVWNTAWGGMTVPMGSAAGCNPAVTPACSVDNVAGIFVDEWTIDPVGTSPRNYGLRYSQVVPSGLPNFPFKLVLRGAVQQSQNLPPIANNVQFEGAAGTVLSWKPVVSDPDNGPSPLTCFIGTPPAIGTATVAADCSSGTYVSGIGFRGIDSFTYGANDGKANSNLATVTAAIVDTNSTACTLAYPVKQYTYSSKSKLTMVVTGNIRSNNNHEVRICPTTRLEYNAISPAPYNYPVVCYINNVPVTTKGFVTVGAQLKCNVKPYAGDQYKVTIKSAI